MSAKKIILLIVGGVVLLFVLGGLVQALGGDSRSAGQSVGRLLGPIIVGLIVVVMIQRLRHRG